MFTLVTMKGCAPCKALKAIMDERGIEYKQLDAHELTNHEVIRHREIMMNNGVRMVPVLFEGDAIMGVGQDAIDFVSNMEK